MSTDPSKYKFNHTCIRVKDPKRSVEFYELLGMKLLQKQTHPDYKFDLYFLGYDSPKAASAGKHWTDRQGVVELTHNYGTESQPDFKYESGNSDPYKGFGHLCISVDHIQAACKRLEDAGVRFQKKLTDGRMKTIAFALDPDGYWIEVIARMPPAETEDAETTETESYRMNHTMIRVKNIEKSLEFYQGVLGMKMQRKVEMKEAKFDLYFLSYNQPPSDETSKGVNPGANQEGFLELTYNYGSEDDPNVNYHNGHDDEKGFSHISITVDHLAEACKRLDGMGVTWKGKLEERGNNIAFIKDPDGYVVEIFQNESISKLVGW